MAWERSTAPRGPEQPGAAAIEHPRERYNPVLPLRLFRIRTGVVRGALVIDCIHARRRRRVDVMYLPTVPLSRRGYPASKNAPVKAARL